MNYEMQLALYLLVIQAAVIERNWRLIEENDRHLRARLNAVGKPLR